MGSEAAGPEGGNGDAGNTLSFLSTRNPHQDAEDDDGEMQILSAVFRGVDIMEVYSPVRVGKICKKYHLVPGESLDLLTGWDLSKQAEQRRARA